MPERAEAFDRPSVLHRSNGIDALNDFLKQTVRTLQGEWTSVVLGPTSLTAIPCRPDVTRKRDSTVVETLCLHLGQLSDRLRFLADNFLNGGVEMWRSGLGGEPPRLSRRPNFLRDGSMGRAGRYSREVRERAVRMVFEHERDYESQWAAMKSIGSNIGCTAETRRRFGRQRSG
jgi:hypothetical protein